MTIPHITLPPGLTKLGIYFIAAMLLLAFPTRLLARQQLILNADIDNTLYQTEMDAGEVQNEFSNGAGSFLFAGRTNLDAGFRLRRGLIRFDLSTLPAGSEILWAELILYQSKIPPGAFPVVIGVHRVLENWGEGASDGIGPEGQGAPAEAGDATWFHRIYNTELWAEPGGSFTETASATTTVGLALVDYSWACTPEMLADIQAWVDNSNVNFGWMVIGGESGGGTARRFNSSENTLPDTRPRLRVAYRPPDVVYSDGFELLPGCE